MQSGKAITKQAKEREFVLTRGVSWYEYHNGHYEFSIDKRKRRRYDSPGGGSDVGIRLVRIKTKPDEKP